MILHHPTREKVRCRGHPLILSRHPTTFEITRDPHLTCRGDCIIGVGADKGAADLSPHFREVLAHDDAVLVTRLSCREYEMTVISQGSSGLLLDHPTDLVWRRSRFLCGRTVGILSDAAALDLPRDMIACLQDGHELVVEMSVARAGSPSGRSRA